MSDMQFISEFKTKQDVLVMSTIRHTIRLYKPSDEADLNFLANLKIKSWKPETDAVSSCCVLYVKQGGKLWDILCDCDIYGERGDTFNWDVINTQEFAY